MYYQSWIPAAELSKWPTALLVITLCVVNVSTTSFKSFPESRKCNDTIKAKAKANRSEVKGPVNVLVLQSTVYYRKNILDKQCLCFQTVCFYFYMRK